MQLSYLKFWVNLPNLKDSILVEINFKGFILICLIVKRISYFFKNLILDIIWFKKKMMFGMLPK